MHFKGLGRLGLRRLVVVLKTHELESKLYSLGVPFLVSPDHGIGFLSSKKLTVKQDRVLSKGSTAEVF